MKIYEHKQEVWTEAECRKISRRRHTDGCGTKETHPGRFSFSGSPYPGYSQTVRYNGGCLRDGEWYDGEHIPFPVIPPSYKIEHVPTWGDYLILK